MASGMGLKGNTGRCFRYFEEFAVCMVSKHLYKNMMMMMIRMMMMMIVMMTMMLPDMMMMMWI